MDEKTYTELVDRLTDLEIALTEHTMEMSPVQRITGTWPNVAIALENMKYTVAKVRQ